MVINANYGLGEVGELLIQLLLIFSTFYVTIFFNYVPCTLFLMPC